MAQNQISNIASLRLVEEPIYGGYKIRELLQHNTEPVYLIINGLKYYFPISREAPAIVCEHQVQWYRT